MRSVWENMEAERKILPPESHCHLHTVFTRDDRIFRGMPEKHGRSLRRHPLFQGKTFFQIIKTVAQQIPPRTLMRMIRKGDHGIAENQGVRPHLLRIRGVSGIGIDIVAGHDSGRSGEMPSSGKTADRQLMRKNSPAFRIGADQPDRPERILLRLRETMGSHPVMQNERMKSKSIEMTGDRFPFGRFADTAVAATGKPESRDVPCDPAGDNSKVQSGEAYFPRDSSKAADIRMRAS